MTIEKLRRYIYSWFEVLFNNEDAEEIMDTIMFRKKFRRVGRAPTSIRKVTSRLHFPTIRNTTTCGTTTM